MYKKISPSGNYLFGISKKIILLAKIHHKLTRKRHSSHVVGLATIIVAMQNEYYLSILINIFTLLL
jgi:hypothetical protein